MKRVLLIVTFIAFTTFLINAQTTTTATNGSEITFKTLVHDYGTVTQGADGNCEFAFTNTGNEPLILSNVQTSCGCTVPSWPKEPIMPGKTATIKVNYTKMSIVGTISKQITVYSNAKNGTIVLSIKGIVTEAPKISSPEKPVNEGFTPIAK
jgi:hypothetical protein